MAGPPCWRDAPKKISHFARFANSEPARPPESRENLRSPAPGKHQRQRCRNDADVPEDGHDRRNQRPVEQRREYEPERVQASADGVEHPHSACQQADDPQVVGGLIRERLDVAAATPPRAARESSAAPFEQDRPAEYLHRLRRIALARPPGPDGRTFPQARAWSWNPAGCSQRLQVLDQRVLLAGGQRRAELVPLVAVGFLRHVEPACRRARASAPSVTKPTLTGS